MGGQHPDYTKYQSISKNPRKMVKCKNNGNNAFEYEHFPVVCPTCEGKGEICEDSNSMVTFVPVKDERFKPAWTKMKITMMVLLMITICGLSTYFLYPRTVEFHVSAHNILDFNFESKTPWMEYTFDVSIKNNNFFSVTIKDISMNLLFMKQTISKLSAGTIKVGMRSEKKTIIKMNATYEDDTSSWYLKKQCYQERDYVGQLMQTSGELDYWVHSEHIESRDDYFYTDCGSLVFPLVVKTTLAPTTTTTTVVPTNTTSAPSANTTTTTTQTMKTKTLDVHSVDIHPTTPPKVSPPAEEHIVKLAKNKPT